MINDELMLKVSELMQDSQLVFLRGQLRNIVRASKDNNDIYYLADLKVPRTLNSNDVYGVSFDLCHLCFSSEFVKLNKLSDDILKSYKDNEVLVNVNINSKINQYKANDGNAYKGNTVRFYVEDIILLNSIEKPSFNTRKVVSL